MNWSLSSSFTSHIIVMVHVITIYYSPYILHYLTYYETFEYVWVMLKKIIQVLLSSLLWWCVYSTNTSKLVNRQAQSGSEPVIGPRANETVAFYTVRTKNREGQVQPKGKQKACKGRVSWRHTFNIVIKVGPEVLGGITI